MKMFHGFVLALLCLHVQGHPQSDQAETDGEQGEEEGVQMTVALHEFKPCENYEDGKLVFKDTETWMINKTCMEVNSTIIFEEDIDKSFKAKVQVKKCPVGDSNKCEDLPEGEVEMCAFLFDKTSFWGAILEYAEGLDVDDCPIPKGTYTTRNAILHIVKDTKDSLKLKNHEGDYYINFFYYLKGELAGCQYVEATLKEDKGGRG